MVVDKNKTEALRGRGRPITNDAETISKALRLALEGKTPDQIKAELKKPSRAALMQMMREAGYRYKRLGYWVPTRGQDPEVAA